MNSDNKVVRKGYRINKNILIEDFKSIYFFIPKNGCTSLKIAVFEYVGDEKYEGNIHRFDFPFANFNRLNTDYNDYLKFTFVRNPWNRLASCYKGKIRSSDFNSKNFKKGVARIFHRFGDLFYGDMPFTEFVEAVCSIPDSEANPHFISQIYWLTNNSGEFLPNYIGRLENMKPSIDEIHKKTGLSLANVKHKNKSANSKSYTELYTQPLREMVHEKFAADIEIFGYEFELDHSMAPIGFVDEAFRNRLANSKYLDQILKEKSKQRSLIKHQSK